MEATIRSPHRLRAAEGGQLTRAVAPRGLVRPLLERDIAPLMDGVGPLVASLYERGADKLLERLEAARDGYAFAHVIVPALQAAPAGLAAEVAKGRTARKLSTFWIAPEHRGAGYGGLLLDHRILAWERESVDAAHVTVRAERAADLERLFLLRGFQRTAFATDRYGIGRDEITLSWNVTARPLLNAA